MERDDMTGNTVISKYVSHSMRETIETIDAYLNSKHISGDKDSLGREKPFFNICTGITNIWYRATDIDRKNITISPSTTSETMVAFLATVKLHEWMKKTNFGMFLNEWGRSLVRYGSSVTKFVEKKGELYCEVVPWNRLIVDPIDFGNNVVVEVLELTPAQLRTRKGFDMDVVESLIEAATTRTTRDGQHKDNKSNFIKLYEVHGELPLEMITEKEEDSETYVQQMHIVSFVENKDGDFENYSLVKGREAKSPYMISHLIKEDGRTLAIGAVEHLFEAQWMMNHTVKAIKDQLDMASKLVFQTSDGNFIGQNALQAIETGDILIHQTNQPLTQVNNGSHDIASLQNYGSMWKSLGQEITSTPDALMGNTAPSGTAWRQVEALQQEAHSLFELFVENKGLYLEEMMRGYIIPHLKTKLDTKEEIVATLDTEGIERIESIYIRNESIKRANKENADMLFAQAEQGTLTQPLNPVTPEQKAVDIQGELQSMGSKRFFSPEDITWEEAFKDLEWTVEVNVTGENAFNREDLATLTTIFQTVADPVKSQVLKTPEGKFLFNQILTKTGAVSPVQMQAIPVGGS